MFVECCLSVESRYQKAGWERELLNKYFTLARIERGGLKVNILVLGKIKTGGEGSLQLCLSERNKKSLNEMRRKS